MFLTSPFVSVGEGVLEADEANFPILCLFSFFFFKVSTCFCKLRATFLESERKMAVEGRPFFFFMRRVLFVPQQYFFLFEHDLYRSRPYHTCIYVYMYTSIYL